MSKELFSGENEKSTKVEITDANAKTKNEKLTDSETNNVSGGFRTYIYNPGGGADIGITCPSCSKLIKYNSNSLHLAEGKQTDRRACPSCGARLKSEFTLKRHWWRSNQVNGTTTLDEDPPYSGIKNKFHIC